MVENKSGYTAGKPRGESSGAKRLRVEVRRGPGRTPGVIEAELVDLSRGGIGLRVAASLAVSESITVRLEDEASKLKLTRSATVRWARRDAEGKWAIGCRFDEQMDWEILGELFLNEILAAERFTVKQPGPILPQPTPEAR